MYRRKSKGKPYKYLYLCWPLDYEYTNVSGFSHRLRILLKGRAALIDKFVETSDIRVSPRKIDFQNQGSFYREHSKCYLKEAQAILENKHWENKNKCVKLIGD